MVYFGKGIYTLSTAAKVLEMSPQKMRRWINGYTYYNSNREYRSIEPLLKPEFEYDNKDVIISFLDLVELLFIKSFIGYNISIQKIREAAIKASKFLNTSHPFAIQKMYTDGKTIFANLAKEESDPSLLDLLTEQYQLGEIIESTLYNCIDFSIYDTIAERWWPLGKNNDIVLDPSRNMGQPILHLYNIKTELIYQLYKSNHSINEICDWYEIDKDSIEAAINFENKQIV